MNLYYCKWQQTKDGKETTSLAKRQFFQAKKRKRSSLQMESNRKKAKAKIAALEKLLSEKTALLEEKQKEAEVFAVLKDSTQTSSNTSDEKNLSMTRNIMNIVARKSKNSD